MHLDDLYVLLVEPSSTQQKIIANYFQEIGVDHLRFCRTGNEAQKIMLNETLDLVVSALYLADMTGTELVTSMRHDDDLKEVAFILISSETSFRYLDPIRQAGSIAILPKPFDTDELKMALNATLSFIDPDEIELQHYEAEDLNVLIVDDSLTARNFIKGVLEKLGMRHFTVAENGQEAVDILDDHFFDLVVTDYNMPIMNGQELLQHIRTKSSQQTVPVLMVTSEDSESRLAAVQQSGVSAVCDKPFATDSVKQLIEQIFSED
ncbi:MAG: response regulator [Methylococcales bacterium]|jgi:two-component system chemotaxis response regulator CheY|nr:response regulator [Methylococcales bacterium]MBT7410348.1 response regulator [Methylococcales bacterium]